MKDGDLWEQFQKTVEAKGPKWVKLRKVKGHATDEMVDEGKVEGHEKLGNDKADISADKGATEEDRRLNDFADLYSHRQRFYADFMKRIKRFIIGMRKAEKEEREKLKANGKPVQRSKSQSNPDSKAARLCRRRRGQY